MSMNDLRTEGELLKHYRLQNALPEAWSDPIEDAQAAQRRQFRQSTTRYSVLQEDGVSATLRSLVGGELYGGGVVPEDEPDPLGSADSVVRVLRKRGLPVEDNVRLRNRYLVSSKTFSPTAFLRDVHATTPSPILQQGLSFLDISIRQKSGSLKELVEQNFDRFVAAKGTIEGVYKEMKDNSFLDKDKESEYGVGRIRANLNEATAKADDIFGPVMKGRGREESLRVVLSAVEKYRDVLELPHIMLESVKRKDYEALVEQYQKARQHLADARTLVPNVPKIGGPYSQVKEDHLHQLVIAEKMWVQVTSIIDEFKRDTWKRLDECKTEDSAHTELIGILLELGVEDNPISVWLFSRYEYLVHRLERVFERSRVQIEVLRRKVAQAPPPAPQTIAHHLCAPSRRVVADSHKSWDTPLVTSFWELLYNSLSSILDPSAGILSELVAFWKTADAFINGDNLLPVGIDDQSRKHHRLPDEDVQNLRSGLTHLIGLICECMTAFFQEPPVEDISSVYSPLPPTPSSPYSPHSPVDGQFNPPPPPVMKGQGVEGSMAFWPPGANSLGAAHYLGRLMVLLGNAAAAMVEIDKGIGRERLESLRGMVTTARDRTVTAISNAWIADAQNCKVMEDWTRAKDNRSVTKMPGNFAAFEKEVIGGMQGIVYLDKVRNSEMGVILAPSAKMLSNVRSQFVRSLYKALQGLVENSKRPVNMDDADRGDGLVISSTAATLKSVNGQLLDSQDKNVRMLLTLSNLQLLRSEIVPELISQFETAFSVKLTDESKTIRDALGQIDAQQFHEYVKPITDTLASTIRGGISSPTWSPPPGTVATEVKAYIYDALLSLVHVHAQVTITAPALVQQVLSYLLEELSRELLDSFKKRRKFSLGELLQATLDVEFVNQTLTQFNTPKAAEWQQMVYVELDRGSDSEARQGLQKELGEMKRILSQLRRHSRAEFLCFRAKKSSRRTNTDSGEVPR